MTVHGSFETSSHRESRDHTSWECHRRGPAELGEQLLVSTSLNDVPDGAVRKRAVVQRFSWRHWLRVSNPQELHRRHRCDLIVPQCTQVWRLSQRSCPTLSSSTAPNGRRQPGRTAHSEGVPMGSLGLGCLLELPIELRHCWRWRSWQSCWCRRRVRDTQVLDGPRHGVQAARD